MESRNICEDVMNVCRLCLGTDSLISIFDDRIRIPENMKDVIQITAGVAISPSDKISQKLCYKCINITIRMFKFRSSSIVNDLQLKEKVSMRKNMLGLHKSVQNLLNQYPKIVLPSSITRLDMSPVVKINKNKIQNWMAEYQRKKKFEKTIRGDKPQIVNSELNRDLENDITPYIITNREITLEEQVEKNTEDITRVGNGALSPVSESLTLVNENEPLNNSGPIRNITGDYIDTVTSSNSQALSKENKSKREPTMDLNASKRKKMKFNPRNDEINSLLDLKYVNESIFLCDICNSILYSNKDLKKHRNKHMRCSLCKKSFRSMRETEEHSENHCPIKHMMNNLPRICIQRCDQSTEIRQQYPSAFGVIVREKIEISPNEQTSQIQPDSSLHETDTIGYSEYDSVKLDISQSHEISLICDNEDVSEEDKSLIQSASQKPEEENISPLKPQIEITGTHVLNLNLDDDEMALLRNILKQYKGNIKESSTQTGFPNNCNIISSPDKDKLFEMRNLREYLNHYKIPVNISYAVKYSATYGNDSSLLAKFQYFSWSVMKQKTKPSMVTHNDKAIILQNVHIAGNTEEMKKVGNIAATTNVTPSILIGKSSQNLSSLNVQNTETNNKARPIESTNSVNRSRSSGIFPIQSDGKSSGHVQNFRSNVIVHNNVSSDNTPNRVHPVILSQIRMNPENINNVNTITPAKTSTVLEDNVFNAISTNSVSKRSSALRSVRLKPPLSQTREPSYSIHDNNVFKGSTLNPTNSSSHAMPYKNTHNVMMRRTNGVATIDHVMLNNRTSLALENLAKVRNKGSYILNTSSVSSNNSMTTPAACTSTISQDSRNRFNIPIATNYNTTANFDSTNVSDTSNMNIYGNSNPYFATPDNVSTPSYRSTDILNYQSIFTNSIKQSQTSASSSNRMNNSSIVSQKRNSTNSTMALPINNNFLQTPVTQEPGGSGIHIKNSEICNGGRSQSASTTASTSQWNRCPNYPLIRVKNVSELR